MCHNLTYEFCARYLLVIQHEPTKRTYFWIDIYFLTSVVSYMFRTSWVRPQGDGYMCNMVCFACWYTLNCFVRYLCITYWTMYTGCHRRKGPNFGRVFLMLNYTDITQNTYIQSWTVSEIMSSEVWNFDSCYTLTDCQIHIETGRNMWFL